VILRQVLAAVCLGAGAGSAAALSLGVARGNVVLGRPVDVAIEVVPDPGKALEDSCITADVVSGDRPFTRVRVVPQPEVAGRAGMVRVLSSSVADEPILNITISAGCAGKTVRTYTFLVDPPAPVLPGQVALPAGAAKPHKPEGANGAAGLGMGGGVPPMVALGPLPSAPRRSAEPKPTKEPAAAQAQKAPKPPRRPVVQKPVPAAPAPTSRLVMEPLEDWLLGDESAPTPLRLSSEMQPVQETTTPQQREQLLAQWKALNMSPEEVLQDSARRAAQEQELNLAKGQAEQERRLAQDLQQALQERFTATWVYALAALALAALAAAAWLWWRMRQLALQAQHGWEAAVVGHASAEAVAESAVLDGAATEPAAPAAAARLPAAPLPVPEPEAIEPSESVLGALTGGAVPVVAAAKPAAAAPVAVPPPPKQALRINPEELFDLQQQAEFFVSVGEHSQAIAVMKKFIAENETTAPMAYLDLLRLYRSLSRVDDFNQLRDQFHTHFNAQVPEFTVFNRPGRSLLSQLEVLAQIEAQWSDAAVVPLLEGMLFREEGVPHERFALEAYDDLLLLYAIARTTQPKDRGAPPPRQRTTPLALEPAEALEHTPQPAPEDIDLDEGMLEFDSAWLSDPPSKSDPLTQVPSAKYVESDMMLDFAITAPGTLGAEPLPPLTQNDLPAVPPTAPPAAGQAVGFGVNNDRFEAHRDPDLHKQ